MELSNIIALVALILSVINFALFIFVRSKKISMDIVVYENHKFSDYYWNCFGIMVQNNSQLPISITRLIIENCDYVKCEIDKQKLKEVTTRTGDVIKNNEITYSVQLPLNISGLDSRFEYFIFKTNDFIKYDNLKIIIYTSRGQLKQMVSFNENIPKLINR